METIDRIMQAYSKKHQLTNAQAALVRDELSAFIDKLLNSGKPDVPIQKGPIRDQ